VLAVAPVCPVVAVAVVVAVVVVAVVSVSSVDSSSEELPSLLDEASVVVVVDAASLPEDFFAGSPVAGWNVTERRTLGD